MDTKRLILAAGLTVVVLWLYQAWLEYQYPNYYENKSESQRIAESKAEKGTSGETPAQGPDRSRDKSSPENNQSSVPETGSWKNSESAKLNAAGGDEDTTAGLKMANDRLRVVFDKRSGNPIRAELKNYHKKNDPRSPAVRVLSEEGKRLAEAQIGWLSKTHAAPSHKAKFTPREEGIEKINGNGAQKITFTHKEKGILFEKSYILPKNSYQLRVRLNVKNSSPQNWKGHAYGQIRFRSGGEGSFFLYSFDGPVVFANDEMETFSLGSLTEDEGASFEAKDSSGWAGVMNRYFLSAWLPDPDKENRIFARGSGGAAFSGFVTPFSKIDSGGEGLRQSRIFLGPKNQDLLEKVGGEHNIRRSVDYGILSFLAIPLFEVMEFFYSLVGNYGIAIILVTLVIKIIFFPLFSMSYRAMAKMRKVQPELQRIREQHGEDRQKMNEEMMRLYKEEKVNPLGGCLPILVQIPVFISLYWVLLESVELRHQPFALWVQDLTSQDPFYILPILMGASMVVQQMMNPAPMDPTQKKIMMGLPVVFTIFFTQFPAGLVLYWLSNNLISIGQQWWIMRKTA